MNKSIFNPYRDIRIDRVKSHHTYLKEKKPELLHNGEPKTDHWSGVPWELKKVKGLHKGKAKKNLDKERIFDIHNDGKLIKVKKETRKDKLSRAYVFMDNKKFHEINGKYRELKD